MGIRKVLHRHRDRQTPTVGTCALDIMKQRDTAFVDNIGIYTTVPATPPSSTHNAKMSHFNLGTVCNGIAHKFTAHKFSVIECLTGSCAGECTRACTLLRGCPPQAYPAPPLYRDHSRLCAVDIGHKGALMPYVSMPS